MRYTHGLVSVRNLSIWWQMFRSSKLEERPDGVIVLFHGYGDHSDYITYENAINMAKESGKLVLAFDQPSFGRSDGLWGYMPDWFEHVDTCMQAIKKIIQTELDNPSLPLIGYGHSMGGGLVATIAIMDPQFFSYIVLSAPMCGIAKNLRHHYLIEEIFFLLARLFPTAPITPVPDLGALCFRDPEFHPLFQANNHLGYPGKPRLGTAKSLLVAQQWLSENAHLMTVPFLIIHGDEDRITPLDASVAFFTKTSSVDKELKIMKGYYHCLIGPGQPKQDSDLALAYVVDWIKNRL